jgi:glycosyltransferase involved in cell wall biosynthesis
LKAAFVTPYLPWPANTGGKLRSFYLLKALAEAAEVDLYTASYVPESELGPLPGFCRSVTIEPLVPAAQKPNVWRQLADPVPGAVRHFGTAESVKAIRTRLMAAYDLLISDEIHMAPYVLSLPGHERTPALVMRQKIEHVHWGEMARRHPWGVKRGGMLYEAWRFRRFEGLTMPQFSAGVVCSQEDQRIARRQARAIEVEVVPNGADAEYFTPRREPDQHPTVLLLGTMNYAPNIDSTLFFFRELYPRIRAEIQDLRVLVVGHMPPPEVVALGNLPGVTVTGSVPDVRPFMSRAWMSGVPLRMGGGTRLKIIEAMMAELPVVSSSVGAQGLDVRHGEHLLLADAPEDFARQTVALLRDDALRHRLAESARALVRGRYSWQTLGAQYARFCQRVAEGVHRGGS